jgi:hypothetical protein
MVMTHTMFSTNTKSVFGQLNGIYPEYNNLQYVITCINEYNNLQYVMACINEYNNLQYVIACINEYNNLHYYAFCKFLL